jgi:hypothetical protein
MRTIRLSKGYHALVDDADFEAINKFKWCVDIRKHKNGNIVVYACRRQTKTRRVFMHRIIMGSPPYHVDHEDHDGLNNQRYNLRVATVSQNCANRRKTIYGNTTSPYKGVKLEKRTGRWVAKIRANGTDKHIGTFKEECDAATAYNFCAYETWGDFALMNQPTEGRPR